MTSNIAESVFFSIIIKNLEKLATLAKNSNHGRDFQWLTMNHRILAMLQVDIHRRGASSENVTDAEFLMLKRGTVWSWSTLQSSIDFFRWSRNTTIQELTDNALLAAKENSLLVALMALRSILEVSGNTILLQQDLQKLEHPKEESDARGKWLNEFESLVDGRLAGVRVDYSALTKKGLRQSGKLSYKPGDFEADQTAKDLLKGVDALDRRVKGARATYEFFSEFAHPNLASVMTHRDRTEAKLEVLKIHGYAVHYQQKRVGTAFLEEFGSVVAEGFGIVAECLLQLLDVDLFLKTKGEEVAEQARKAIREIVRHDPGKASNAVHTGRFTFFCQVFMHTWRTKGTLAVSMNLAYVT